MNLQKYNTMIPQKIMITIIIITQKIGVVTFYMIKDYWKWDDISNH